MQTSANRGDDWKALVEDRIEQTGSIQAVADEIGYARSSLSLALKDKYIGSTKKIEAAVLKRYANVLCPYLQVELSKSACLAYKNREAPTQNPAEIRHWRACQKCPVGCHKTRKDNLKGNENG